MPGQIIARGKDRYVVRIYGGRDASGRRQYINKTVHGKRKDAERWRTKMLRDKDLGELVHPSRESVAEYLGRWLRTIGAKVRCRTLRDYTYYVHKYIDPAIGRRRLDQLSARDLDDLYSAMSARGLTPRTVIFTHAVLRGALNGAVKLHLLQRNPCDLATAVPAKRRGHMDCLNASEAQRFLAAARQDDRAALWMLLLTTGMRPGEACGLRWADLEGNRVHIQRTLVPGYKGSWKLEEPKTSHSRRSVPLSPSVLRELERHHAAQAAERLRAGETYRNHGFIFANELGEPLHPASLSKRPFHRILKAAGLRATIRMYSLRHSCATLLLANGENAKVVAERLGHASTTMTQDVYSHVLPDMQQAAAEKLERLLFG